jgi:hypothetical protein
MKVAISILTLVALKVYDQLDVQIESWLLHNYAGET